VHGETSWHKLKAKIEKDSRYKAADGVYSQKEMFKEYVEQLNKEGDSSKHKDKERQERVEASLRERERLVRESQAELLKEREKEKEHHNREKALQHFRAFLADMVRNANATWKETRRSLKKDHRWALASSLGKEEKEKCFTEHVEQLVYRKKDQFRKLLDETPKVTLSCEWKSVRKEIKEDPRFSKFSSSDRKREAEFTEYLKDKMIAAKADFRQLLKETHLINYRTKENMENHHKHLKEITDVLKNDKRYLVLDCVENERHKMLLNFIDELHRKGPPPPPTASAPSNRSKR